MPGFRTAGFRRGLGVSAALLLATAALAGLSIQSVYREAQVRKRLIEDMHRSIADVITARLDAAMIEEERAATAELQSVPPRSARLLGKMREMEQFRPWLAPLVLLPTAIDANASPSDSGTERFHDMLAQAERAEYQDESPARATKLYSSAASMISAGLQRAKALNGQARTELKAGDPLRAAATYKKLIDGAETLHPEEARIALIAWEQLAASHARRGDRVATGDAAIGLYEFLLTHRFILDEDTYSFYKSKVDEQLTHAAPDRLEPLRRREQQLDAAAPLLAAALSGNNKSDRVRRLPKSAHVWTLANVTTLLEHSLADPGPWSDVRTAIIEDGAAPEAGTATLPLARIPQWRITASPKAGSVDTLATRDTLRFAALLALVFGAVVAAMLLAARSVSRELALSRLRSEFVASVSHELKTPLSLIRMFAESLREGWVTEDKRANYYEVITRESERLTGLINNVLDFSRMENGVRKYERVTSDLRGIVVGLLERYQYHLKTAQIDLIEDLPDEPVYALIDSGAIEQVLVNLLSNAVKYMGESPTRNVRVSLTADVNHAVITIADSGIGISAQDRVHVFERFWRADDVRVRSVAGSGLGLTLVKHVVEAHEGAIAVESAPGRGSTFAVTLPIAAGGRS